MYASEQEINALVAAFRQKSLPAEHWNHQAHLTVALAYLLEYTADAALCNLRADIIQYNSSVGGVNNHERGYHETLTQFWLDMVLLFLQEQPSNQELLPLTNRLLSSEFADKNLPLRYYSEHKLFSVSARARYMPPDLV